MNHDINDIFKKWDEYIDTHTRQLLPDRKQKIMALLNRLKKELKSEATFSIEDQNTSFTIRIAADSFIASDDAPALRTLIQEANVFHTDIVDDQIVFDLWYMCWEWVEK